MDRRVCSAFCFGCGSDLTLSSSMLPSLPLSVMSDRGRRRRKGRRESDRDSEREKERE